MKKIQQIDIKKIYSWAIFTLAVLNIIVFIFIANKIYFRLDLTEGQKYSISKPSVEILKDLQDQLIIEYYYNDKSKEVSEMALVIQYVVDML
ncbi:MAG TPA: Gldg family protein, partial [Spirochaetota bacterium]|nr:Gldg family protein [Spirochaetota bacterium]